MKVRIQVSKIRAGLIALLIAAMSTMGISPSSAAAPSLGAAATYSVLAGTYVAAAAAQPNVGKVGANAAVSIGGLSNLTGDLYAGAAVTVGAASSFTTSNPDGLSVCSGAAITVGAASTGSAQLNAVAAVTVGAASDPTLVPHAGNTGDCTGATTDFENAKAALVVAKTNINLLPATSINAQLGNVILTPGVYELAASLNLTGTLTLNAQNDSNAIFIIKTDSFISTAAGSSVVLLNGALARNVFWSTGTYFAAGAGSTLVGHVLATTYISIGAGSTVDGHLYSLTSYVTF